MFITIGWMPRMILELFMARDQSFTVGFAPSATTLPPMNGANGATLEAAVNPEGWDTTVYFQWETPTLTNTTPGIDIGAGATSVNVSSFVPGLSASTPYQYQVVASNALGTAFGAVVYWDPNQQPLPVQRVEDEYHSEPGHLHHHCLRRSGRLRRQPIVSLGPGGSEPR